jgi:RNA polymerase sigma-70 factor (ECF subfamily)
LKSQQINNLIKATLEGSQKAQMQLYDTYCQAMFNIACRYLKNHEDAKDAMQEGFLKAFVNIKSYKDTSAFGARLKRIIINQCIDVLKKRQFITQSLEIENSQVVDDNDDWQFDSAITKQDITNAIDKLSEKYKTVITLYLLEGYDHEELSQILGIPVKTSRTQLRRAKLQLQDALKTKYNEARY